MSSSVCAVFKNNLIIHKNNLTELSDLGTVYRIHGAVKIIETELTSLQHILGNIEVISTDG